MIDGGIGYFSRRLARFAKARWCSSVLKSALSAPPLTLHIEATNRCNLNCQMCFQQTMKREKGAIDVSFYKEIIDSATGWVEHLQIANFGEPLMHPELEEMISYASSKGFFVEVFTNGVLLDDDAADMFVRAGTGKVNVSIDALDSDVYEKIRSTPLAPVLLNLNRLAKARINAGSKSPFIVLAASDLKANTGQPAAMKSRFAKTGADALYVTPSMNWAGSAEDGDFIKPSGTKYRGCLFPWYLMNVSFEGIVTPCCIDAELGNAIGDIKQGGIKDIWNSEPARILRKALLSADMNTLDEVSNCTGCSRLYYSQNSYTLNRASVEFKQLLHFTGL